MSGKSKILCAPWSHLLKHYTSLTPLVCRALELHVWSSDEWFSDGVAYPKLPWLSKDLLPKLVRWTTECKSSEFKNTLSLLPVEKYSVMYQQLKDKYKAMVKVEGYILVWLLRWL